MVAISDALVRMAAPPVMATLGSSWRVRVHAAEHRNRLLDAGEPFIYLLWHETLLPCLWVHRRQGIAIIVSQGREGRYLGDYASGIGYTLLHGSSSRGGARALLGAVRALATGTPVAITPDGPRGPRRVMKAGVVKAAERSGAWVLPLHCTASRAWRLGSWDRMVVPKPMSSVVVGYGEPFRIDPGSGGLEQGMRQCEQALSLLEEELVAS